MAKPSFVLQALKILGPEEILKLSEVLHVKQVAVKKAAGAELIVCDDTEIKRSKKSSSETGKLLTFPKKSINDLMPEPEEVPDTEKESSADLLSSDVILWQRQLTQETSESSLKGDAIKGYKKSSEMYVVKTPTEEGKTKIRFASTNGILINKKQA